MTLSQAHEAINLCLESYFASAPDPTSDDIKAIYDWFIGLVNTETIPTTPATLDTTWTAAGRTVIIQGEIRTIISLRLCYGASINLTLNTPLTGNTSKLYTVDESNVGSVLLVN
jgi:hypothetical protein